MGAPRTDPQYIVDPETGCWIWQWALHPENGYGIWNVRGKRGQQAHRHYYEMLVGPIPEGLTIDHLCRNRPCVNPAHLEPVTSQENRRRAPGCLSTADVIAIRADPRPHVVVAAERGIRAGKVAAVRAGRNAPDVPMPDPPVKYEKAWPGGAREAA